MNTQLLRFNTNGVIQTRLDPMEDLLNLFSSLRSRAYTKDLLRQKRGFTDRKEIEKVANLVKLHAEMAIALADEGLSGPADTSYLPLYYSTLNLAKVRLLLMGRRLDLEKNRAHGARYRDKEMSRSLENEEILIQKRGSIPLVYSATSGASMPAREFRVKLGEIYPFIRGVSAEYEITTGKKPLLLDHKAIIMQDNDDKFFLRVTPLSRPAVELPARLLKCYQGLTPKGRNSSQPYFETKRFSSEEQLLATVNRTLLVERYESGIEWITSTPLTGKRRVLSSDLCVMLAYFHMSNVVRYNPVHLAKLVDSKYWILLLALRKHGFFYFLVSAWSDAIQTSFDVCSA